MSPPNQGTKPVLHLTKVRGSPIGPARLQLLPPHIPKVVPPHGAVLQTERHNKNGVVGWGGALTQANPVQNGYPLFMDKNIGSHGHTECTCPHPCNPYSPARLHGDTHPLPTQPQSSADTTPQHPHSNSLPLIVCSPHILLDFEDTRCLDTQPSRPRIPSPPGISPLSYVNNRCTSRRQYKTLSCHLGLTSLRKAFAQAVKEGQLTNNCLFCS